MRVLSLYPAFPRTYWGHESFSELGTPPPPRCDLFDVSAYDPLSTQWRRGCPFNCVHCDNIEVFGRDPRSKIQAQFCSKPNDLQASAERDGARQAA